MHTQEYRHMFENEGEHFYYQANHEIILSLIRRYVRKTKPTILDAGCGTGYFVQLLGKIGTSAGFDISDDALAYAKKKGANVIKGSISKIPYASNMFDVVTSVDVINHLRVKNPQKAFSELYRVLKPGGILVLRVSANPNIHLSHDARVHLDHRWSAEEVRDGAVGSGLKICVLTHINMLLLPAAYILQAMERFAEKRHEKSSVDRVPTIVNAILTKLLTLEKYLIPHVRLPFGLGILLVAQKPD